MRWRALAVWDCSEELPFEGFPVMRENEGPKDGAASRNCAGDAALSSLRFRLQYRSHLGGPRRLLVNHYSVEE